MDSVALFVRTDIAVLVWTSCAKRAGTAAEERFPPISDTEFMAKCGPGVSPRVAMRVRRIVADSLGANYDRLHPATHFNEDLGAS